MCQLSKEDSISGIADEMMEASNMDGSMPNTLEGSTGRLSAGVADIIASSMADCGILLSNNSATVINIQESFFL